VVDPEPLTRSAVLPDHIRGQGASQMQRDGGLLVGVGVELHSTLLDDDGGVSVGGLGDVARKVVAGRRGVEGAG
jgi:hypothetical protein